MKFKGRDLSARYPTYKIFADMPFLRQSEHTATFIEQVLDISHLGAAALPMRKTIPI